jgi:CBS-domain-containing membrane protein
MSISRVFPKPPEGSEPAALCAVTDAALCPDPVTQASEESFPASDPPAWVARPAAPDAPQTAPYPRVVLSARTAIDFMTTNLVSIRGDATLQEASVLLTNKGYCAVPVVDEAGKPVGVISQSDLLVHARENFQSLSAHLGLPTTSPQEAEGAKPFTPPPEPKPQASPTLVLVRDVMTPAVFAVTTDAPARKVVEELLNLKVHQLFVVDEQGLLIASVSATDVLKHLHLEDA